MEPPNTYAEFTYLQNRFRSCLLCFIVIVIVTGVLSSFIDSPHLITLAALLAFYFWFRGVATYFEMVNWRCPSVDIALPDFAWVRRCEIQSKLCIAFTVAPGVNKIHESKSTLRRCTIDPWLIRLLQNPPHRPREPIAPAFPPGRCWQSSRVICWLCCIS